jgi:superfamily II DNA or RNA helicase
MKLREYQREAIDDLYSRWDAGSTRVPLVLATGLGKTVIFTTMIEEWLSANPGKRVLVIAHTNELIDQAVKKMREVAPHRRVGIVKGPINSVTAEVIVSSRQTLASEKRRSQIRNVGLLVIDECHHAHSKNTYGKIIRHFGGYPQCEHSSDPHSLDMYACDPCMTSAARAEDEVSAREWVEPPRIKVAGFTATLARSDKMKLSTVWEDCSFKRDILFGIRRGYLLDVRGERVVVAGMDMANVRQSGGDYAESALAEELERTFAVETIAKEYARLAHDRKGVAFWPLVATAEHAASVFRAQGIPSAALSGKTPASERKAILRALRVGDLQVVHNAMVLTEGFDDPTLDVAVIGRPTRSAPLYQQMVGRVLRPDLTMPASARKPALVIDVTGASEGNDLRSLIDLSPERPLKNVYEDHLDATLSELEEIFASEIEEEVDAQRAGASFTFESDEYSGATTTKTFDPLGRSKVWGQTEGGTYYVKSSRFAKADSFVFIVESIEGDPGTYDIVGCSANSIYNPDRDERPPWATGTDHKGLHLDMALSWGEELAGDAYNSRKTSWRGHAPSQKLLNLARMYGIEVTPDMNAGQIGEAVDQRKASIRIDALVAAVRSSVQESNV